MLRDGRRPRGVVFDLDGTLTDNMGLHMQAFERICARHGLRPLTPERRAQLDGKRNRDIFPYLFGRELAPEELRALIDEKESLYRELSAGRLPPGRPGAAAAAAARARGASGPGHLGAGRERPPHAGRDRPAGGLPHVVRSDEVPRGKPAPDVFLAAAGWLGQPPADCLAFEDAPMGVESALAAGLTCVAVTTSFDPRPSRRTAPRPTSPSPTTRAGWSASAAGSRADRPALHFAFARRAGRIQEVEPMRPVTLALALGLLAAPAARLAAADATAPAAPRGFDVSALDRSVAASTTSTSTPAAAGSRPTRSRPRSRAGGASTS